MAITTLTTMITDTATPTTSNTQLTSTSLTSPSARPAWTAAIIVSALLILISIVSTVGNCILLLIIAKTSALRTKTNAFVGSLTFSYLLIGCLVTPYSTHVTLNVPSRDETSTGYCKFSGFVLTLCDSATLLSLCMVCVDRTVAVTRPLKYSIWIDPWCTGAMLVYVWIHSFLMAVLPLLNVGGVATYQFVRFLNLCSFVDEPLVARRSLSFSFSLAYACLSFIGPVIAILVLILLIVRSSHQRSISHILPLPIAAILKFSHHPVPINYRRSTLQAMKTLFIIVFVFLTLKTPALIVMVLTNAFGVSVLPEALSLAGVCSLLSSMINPLIFLMNRRFKARLAELSCRCLPKNRRVGPVVTVTANTLSTNAPFESSLAACRAGTSAASPSGAKRPWMANLSLDINALTGPHSSGTSTPSSHAGNSPRDMLPPTPTLRLTPVILTTPPPAWNDNTVQNLVLRTEPVKRDALPTGANTVPGHQRAVGKSSGEKSYQRKISITGIPSIIVHSNV